MTAHEFARKLLSLPDYEVYFTKENELEKTIEELRNHNADNSSSPEEWFKKGDLPEKQIIVINRLF